MPIKLVDIKILWAKSGNRCAMCNNTLVIDHHASSSCPIGEQAHIKGDKPGSARYDSDQSDIERNSYSNLILLCPTCHTIIDKDMTKYSILLLRCAVNLSDNFY